MNNHRPILSVYPVLSLALSACLFFVAICLYSGHLKSRAVSFPVIFCDSPMSGKAIDSVVLSIDQKEIEQYERSGW